MSVAGVKAGPRRGTRVTGLGLRVSTQGQAAPPSTERSPKYLQFSRSFPRIVFFLGLRSPAPAAIPPHSWERKQFSITLPERAALRHPGGFPHREPRAFVTSLLHRSDQCGWAPSFPAVSPPLTLGVWFQLLVPRCCSRAVGFSGKAQALSFGLAAFAFELPGDPLPPRPLCVCEQRFLGAWNQALLRTCGRTGVISQFLPPALILKVHLFFVFPAAHNEAQILKRRDWGGEWEWNLGPLL